MNLKKLIETVEWSEVETIHKEVHNDEIKILPGIQNVFEHLKTLKPTKMDMVIHIEHVIDDDLEEDNEWEDVFCIDGKGEKWACDFVPWSDWLGMEISKETLKNYTKPEIVAHCIWEMTFHGFTEEKIQKKVEELEKIMEDVRSGKVKLLSHKEVFGDK